MDICPVCEISFDLLEARVLVQNCECREFCFRHSYHYEHPWCHESLTYPSTRPSIAAAFAADARVTAVARPAAAFSAGATLTATAQETELKLFVFELWPGIELNVLATSDGRVHNTRVDMRDASVTAIR